MHACADDVDNKVAITSASWRSGGLCRRQIVLRAAPGFGYPRPLRRSGRAGTQAVSVAGLALDMVGGVEQVLEQDVLDVLGADAARAQRGEAGLHQEDQRTCAARAGGALSTIRLCGGRGRRRLAHRPT